MIKKFNDYLVREYTTSDRLWKWKFSLHFARKKDIVYSLWKHKAVHERTHMVQRAIWNVMYTKFDGTKKVLAIMQVLESETDEDAGEDLERRKHCSTLTEATDPDFEVKTKEADFDHWKTYGEQNHYAARGKSGFYTQNAYYPNKDDTKNKRFESNYTGSGDPPTNDAPDDDDNP